MNLATVFLIIGGCGFFAALVCGFLILCDDEERLKKPAIIILALSLITVISGACLMDHHMAHQIVKEIK